MNQHTYPPPSPKSVHGTDEAPFYVMSWDYTWVSDLGTDTEMRCIAFTTSRDLDTWELSNYCQRLCDTYTLFLYQGTEVIKSFLGEFGIDPMLPHVGSRTAHDCPYHISEEWCASMFDMDALIAQAKTALELGQIPNTQDEYEMEDEDE